jgi:Raf kinase inhibitor-like YbhB/YbcL family protein
LVLIVDDPDAPMGTWVHWVVYDIAVASRIVEHAVPGTQGKNDFGKKDYGGPCPPTGTHRYFFKVYALDVLLNLKPGSAKADVEKAMRGHILANGQLIGKYSRSG